MENGNNMEILEIDIKKLIYTIRGKQVMLDRDLAKLHNCSNGTKAINLAVKRHINRFPERFMFKLTEEECKNYSRFQTETLNRSGDLRGYNIKYLPYAFTEQGVGMLATVLRTEIAEEVSVRIMDAFAEMRKFINTNGQLFYEINNIKYRLSEHDKNFDIIFNELQKTKKEEFKEKVFFEGQIWDSYELIIDIIKSAKNKIVIIDNYIDDTILKMIQKKNKNVEVVLLTSQNCNLTKLDVKKFNEQYPVLKITRKIKKIDMVSSLKGNE